MEIELRVKLDDPEKVRKALVKRGARFNKTTKKQSDRYYLRKGLEEAPVKLGDPIFRIREEGKKALFTAKLMTSQAGIWEEHEVVINDSEEMRRILDAMGFVETFTITKKRREGKLRKFTLCLDEIEVLGNYLEVEVIAEDGPAAQEEARQLLHEIGFGEEEIEPRGYARMIREQMGIRYEEG